MGRSRSSAKSAGSRLERETADYLAITIDDRIDRQVKTGAKDKGDIAGVRTREGEKVAIECKDVINLNLSGWIGEAEVERQNAGAAIGVVVHKRRGVGDPGLQYVTMTMDSFIHLLIGHAPVKPEKVAKPSPSEVE